MPFSLIYSIDDSYAVEVGGILDVPAYSIIESDEDGIRLFVTATDRIPEHYWRTAFEYSPAFIVSAESNRAIWVDEVFFDNRKTVDSHHVAPEWMWQDFGGTLTSASALMAAVEHVEVPERFGHLHTHSEYSALDGLSRVGEIVEAAVADGQPFVAITDHGNCAAHPDLQRECDKHGVKPIFGMEAYLQDDRHARGTDVLHTYWHLTLWAETQQGLLNLWAMSTEAFADGLYGGKPRLDWDTLSRHAEGVLASTGCLRGPVSHPLVSAAPEDRLTAFEAAAANLGRLERIFGDRLYVELHTNQLDEQKAVNHELIEMARRHSLPTIAVVDSHYACPEDQHTHDVWLRVSTGKDIGDELGMFGGGHEYHLLTEAEVRASLAYLGPEAVEAAVTETSRLAARCTAKLEPKPTRPIYSRRSHHDDPLAADVKLLRKVCYENWDKRTKRSGIDQSEYIERFEYELSLLIEKEFCGYFLMVWDAVNWAKENHMLVGPSRGSGGGSLVAYLMRITEIDPVRQGLLFARFMTKGREELPDFDLDFPQSDKLKMTNYVRERWGSDHVAIAGTHLRLKNKSVVKDVTRTLKSQLAPEAYGDIETFSKLVDACEADTAGLGLSWEDLWVQHGDVLQPFADTYPEVFELAERMVGRLKSYGKHPAGLIIDPDTALTGMLPLRMADDGQMVTQFDFPALEMLGFVKFDFLNLRTLDTIQHALRLIHERTGEWINIYEWDEEYEDPSVYEEICSGHTLGHFQTETTSGQMMVKRFQPTDIAGLSDVTTLVRPGPMRSGLTDAAIRRKFGEEPVEVLDPRLEPVLAQTWGCMLYQEDIMATTMVLAGYDDLQADYVRKILGKKKVELAKIEGEKFISAAVERGADASAMRTLWDQMEQFAKYSFNRSHARGYAILCFWTAWLKYHYPVEFLCAALSTVKAERISEFVEEARRMGYSVLPPDINVSGKEFTADGNSVRFGLEAIKGVGEAAVTPILEHQPYTSYEDFMERKTGKCTMAAVRALVRIGAFDSLVANRRGLESYIDEAERKEVERCTFRDAEVGQNIVHLKAPTKKAAAAGEKPTEERWHLPCAFDWANEPQPGRTGKELAPDKRKAPPKKCSKACRQFDPVPMPQPEDYPSYTRADIRNIEMEVLGVWLSSTPFERLSDDDRADLATAVDILSGPNGSYMAAIYMRNQVRMDRQGRGFGFITCHTEMGSFDAIVFDKNLSKYKTALNKGGMFLATIGKNNRGQSLTHLIELD